MRENNYQYKQTFKMDWLSQIPSHWFEVRLGSLFNERKSKVSDIDYPPLSVTKNGIVPQLENAAKSNDGDNRKLVLNGDFVINSRSDRKGSSGLSRLDGSVSLINIVLRPIENIDPKFSEYLLKSYFFKEEYYRYGRGIVEDLWTTRYSEMKNMIIPKPPFEEQTAIARFLDYKLAKINRFIQKKKQLIKLLNEQKAAIINQAVTKGLDPNAKMKDSGIEWLGEIPEHWEVRKLKTIVSKKITDGPHETPEFVEKGIPFISAEAVNSDGSISFENRRADISKELDQIYSLKCKPQRDDVFIVKSGSTTGKIGFVNTDLDFNIWSPLALVRSKKELITGEYTFRTLQSPYFQSQVQTKWSFGTQPNIGMGVLENLYVIVPPKSEQTQILNFISEEIEPIFLTISKIEKELALTEEYKTALIAEAVTGKIDVRGYEIPEITEEETCEEIEDPDGYRDSMAAEDAEEYQRLEE